MVSHRARKVSETAAARELDNALKNVRRIDYHHPAIKRRNSRI
jgi:hypothetical protein